MKTIQTIAVLFASLLLLACQTETDAEHGAGTPSENRAVDLVVADNIKKHVAYLADDALEGRMTGEEGYDKAAAYVAEFFEELGLTPGGNDGWYQTVTFQSYKLDTESARVVAHRDGKDIELAYRDDFGMYADKVRDEKSVRAEVVYAGFGVHAPERGYSDYDGLDVDGKIVAIFSGGPSTLESTERAYYTSSQVKSREAYSRGAVGFISLISRRSEENYPWEQLKARMGKRASMTWLSETGDAANYWPEGLGSIYLNPEASKELFSGTPISFEEARDATESNTVASVPLGFEVTIETKTTFDELTSPNVIGIVRGTDPELADEYVVYTGHLDHVGIGTEVDGDKIYNGAYDNAMGIALMMEAARSFAAKPPKRSVMFIALTGEERGLLGSDYFVNYPTVPIDSIVANINLDMPLFLFPVADLVAFGSEHSSLVEPVEKAANKEGFTLTPDPIPEEGLFRRSDQYSFVRAGIPAIYLIPGFTSLDPEIDGEALFNEHLKEHYHKPSDDLGRPVDWESAERFGRANTRIGFEIANDPERPRWNEGDFFGEKFGRDVTLATSE